VALPREVKHWSPTTLRKKLVKIRTKVTRHSAYVTFQLAEVAVTRDLFPAILHRIARLWERSFDLLQSKLQGILHALAGDTRPFRVLWAKGRAGALGCRPLQEAWQPNGFIPVEREPERR